MLIGGMDVSGDKITGNYKYLAIVIGTQENIQSLSDKISQKTTRMSKLKVDSQESVISKLNFDRQNRIAFCVALDRTRIIDQVKNIRAVKKSRKRTGNIIRTFNHVVMRRIISKLEEFAIKHSISLTEIIFECDSDCQPFAKSLNVKFKPESKAHNIADKVAWCNNKGKTPPSVIDLDFTNEIAPIMIKILNLN